MSLVIADFGVNGALPATVGGTGTAVKYFGRNAAYAQGAVWTSPATPSSSNANGLLVVPADLKLNGTVMEVTAAGAFLPSAAITSSETVEVAIYGVTGTLTSPTYTKIATCSAYAPGVDGIWYNFLISALIVGNNDSGIVGGVYTSLVNNTVETNNAALAASLTGISFGQLSNQPPSGAPSLGGPFGLVVGVTFSQSDSKNSAKLYEFSISE
jgi:hypothetical protein